MSGLSNFKVGELSLGANNSTVTKFEQLVNFYSQESSNRLATVSDTANSALSTANSYVSDATSNVNSALSQINKAAEWANQQTGGKLGSVTGVIEKTTEGFNTVASGASTIVSTATNVTNTALNTLSQVQSTATSMVTTATSAYSSLKSSGLNVINSIKAIGSNPKELGKNLYDAATSIADMAKVGYDVVGDLKTKAQSFQYIGENLYKDLEGQISGSVDSLKGVGNTIKGWFSKDETSEGLGILTNNGTSSIISTKSLKPAEVVADLQPAYNKLQEKYLTSNSNIKDDLKDSTAELITNKDSDIKDKLEKQVAGDVSGVTGTELAQATNIGDIQSYGYSTTQNSSNKYIVSRLGDLMVQAMLYDIPDDSTGDVIKDRDKASNLLLCFQQPDNISYSAQASYDTVQTRGSQQPFMFYQCANAITMNFTLKWHIDELRMMNYYEDDSYQGYVSGYINEADQDAGQLMSLQDIAAMAEDFTRPWKNRESITPKRVRVVLPGIVRSGYITSAQITYTGDMTGSLHTMNPETSPQGDKIGNINSVYSAEITEYYYSQIEVSFELMILQEIELRKQDSKAWHRMDVAFIDEFQKKAGVHTKESNETETDSTEDETQQNSAESEETPVNDEINFNEEGIFITDADGNDVLDDKGNSILKKPDVYPYYHFEWSIKSELEGEAGGSVYIKTSKWDDGVEYLIYKYNDYLSDDEKVKITPDMLASKDGYVVDGVRRKFYLFDENENLIWSVSATDTSKLFDLITGKTATTTENKTETTESKAETTEGITVNSLVSKVLNIF